MSRLRPDAVTVKFAAFTTVMIVVAAFLFLVFSDSRSGDTADYSAVFTDSSGLRTGESVRIAGVRVGTVDGIRLLGDNTVRVSFDLDRSVALPADAGAAIRYLNLVGDRYLEVTDGSSATRLRPGGEIPSRRTTPALDLDVLLGGLKPVIDGLEPTQVNELSSAVLGVLQGQRSTVQTLFSSSSSLFTTLGRNNGIISDLITQLTTVLTTLQRDSSGLGDTVTRLSDLIGVLAQNRDPIGAAITAIDNGTRSVADLLTEARPPLTADIDQLARLAPNLDAGKDTLDTALQRAPENFRKLSRTGTYGNFVQYYLCAIEVRATDASGKVFSLPVIQQRQGRCSG